MDLLHGEISNVTYYLPKELFFVMVLLKDNKMVVLCVISVGINVGASAVSEAQFS